ncbi:MAG: hypothetical protein M0030_13195 [Actinomycetota bacterium]|nr:hypothetical protein [Actinomycetota bacterium]
MPRRWSPGSPPLPGARQEVAVGLLGDHLHHCVRDPSRRSDADCADTLAEVTATIRQVVRL